MTLKAGLGSQVLGAVEENVCASEPRRHRTVSHGRVAASKYPTMSSSTAGRIFESGPKSRGFPYASMAREAMPTDSNLLHSDANPAHSVDPEIDI